MRTFCIIAAFFLSTSVDWDGDDPGDDDMWWEDDGAGCEGENETGDWGCSESSGDGDADCVRSCENGYKFCIDKVAEGTTSADSDQCEKDRDECLDGCSDGIGCT